jgi:hypothetical protein
MYYVDPDSRKRRNIHEEPVDHVKEGLIVALWQTAGLDTYDIAKKLGLHEWQVHNLLLHLREGQR